MNVATDVWRVEDMPDQAGRTIVVTGTTVGGLGFETALELARRGARVVLAGRNPDRLADSARSHPRRRSPTPRSSRRRSTSPTWGRYDGRARSCPASGRSTRSSTTPA